MTGHGIPYEPGEGDTALRCGKCGNTWIGAPDEPCMTCVKTGLPDNPFADTELANMRCTNPLCGLEGRTYSWVTHCARCGFGEMVPATEHTPIELIDWSIVHDHPDEIVSGLLIPGRWTSNNAKPKVGKTTLEMFVTVEISEGRDPFDGTPIDPVTVLYVDAEMGRLDLEERLHELGHPDPLKLTNWHSTDMPPRLDTIPGGNALLLTAQELGATVVVIDGINGTVSGAEKDDTTWRPFFEHSIMPLKRAGIAVWTGDNLGKDESLGPRGSSVKMDKPDAVMMLKRTDNGIKLTTPYRRTSAYPLELLLSIDGTDGDKPITYRRTDTAWPNGTEDTARLLDELGVSTKDGRGKVRQTLTEAGHRIRNEPLAAAIRYRRLHPRIATFDLGDGVQ